MKTGTRTARRIGTADYTIETDPSDRQGIHVQQDPERDVYVHGSGDKKIRIQGHWGSVVEFRNVQIRSIGSEKP